MTPLSKFPYTKLVTSFRTCYVNTPLHAPKQSFHALVILRTRSVLHVQYSSVICLPCGLNMANRRIQLFVPYATQYTLQADQFGRQKQEFINYWCECVYTIFRKRQGKCIPYSIAYNNYVNSSKSRPRLAQRL